MGKFASPILSRRFRNSLKRNRYTLNNNLAKKQQLLIILYLGKTRNTFILVHVRYLYYIFRLCTTENGPVFVSSKLERQFQ